MYLNSKFLGYVPAAAGLFVSTAAFAANPDFRLSHQAVRLVNSSVTKEVTVKGVDKATESTESSTGIETFPAGWEIAAFLGEWAIYNYPGSTGWTMWVGYTGIPDVEIGPTFAIGGKTKTTETKDVDNSEVKEASSSFNVGVYAYYSVALGVTSLELTLNPYFMTGSTTKEEYPAASPTTKVESETTDSGFGVLFDVTAPFALAENFEYAPGLDLAYTSKTSEVKDGAKTETSELAIGLNFAKFRYNF